MDHMMCPGARFLRQPRPEMFECPDCGAEVEIWSDEIRGTCSSCGRHVFREGLPSCVQWCKYAKECVGAEAFGRYQRNRAIGLKQRLLEVLQGRGLICGEEAALRERALARAERILEGEPEAAWHLVIPATLLHDVPFGQGPDHPSLEKLLHAQGLDPQDIAAIQGILAELSGAGTADLELEARVVRDAWGLAESGKKKKRTRAVR
ncbi:MAG: hypothetical protein JW820_09840 [Spirochaetales bacterium]|nr:hypothetical protein [Spirochaetales bacterium]